MRRWPLIALLAALLLATPVARGEGASGGVDHLPTPAGLEPAVHFWELVFAKYDKSQCVFHDTEDLSVIYGVKRIPGGSARVQSRYVRHYLSLIRGALKHLATGAKASTSLERRIVEATASRLRYPAYYHYAMGNVRCQRGVDLGPGRRRAHRHMGMVLRALKERGLPSDLAYLPYLESGYNPRARSRAGARGLWQLMPAAARLMGLRVNRHGDLRTSPYRSTRAAAHILQDLYNKTHSWPLAITAYNYGINGMTRAIAKWGDDYMTIRKHHRTRVFGFAARNYYPSFLAVRNIVSGLEGERQDNAVALDDHLTGRADRRSL